jgi:hypothetical protein
VSLLTLNPVQATKALPLNLTEALVPLGSNTGVLFTNTGRELLVVSVGTTATTATSQIGLTIQGQTVPGVSSGPLDVSAISVLGPWPSQFDRTDGTYQVEVDFSSATDVSVALIQMVGVS